MAKKSKVEGSKSPVRRSIRRATILEAIRRSLDSAESWASSWSFDYAARNSAQAEALIQILEADDCGSYGGFDRARGQTHPSETHEVKDRLRARYEWLASLPVATREERASLRELKKARERVAAGRSPLP